MVIVVEFGLSVIFMGILLGWVVVVGELRRLFVMMLVE